MIIRVFSLFLKEEFLIWIGYMDLIVSVCICLVLGGCLVLGIFEPVFFLTLSLNKGQYDY